MSQRDQADGLAHRPAAGGGVAQVVAFQDGPQVKFDHRLGVVRYFPQLLRAVLGAHQVGGVAAGGHHRHPQVQVQVGGNAQLVPPHRRPLPGRVGVESQDDGGGEPAQQFQVPSAQGGAAGGHRRRIFGLVEGDHIGVALHHHRPPGAADLGPGQVQAVQQVAFLVKGGFGGVQIFGVLVPQCPAPETDQGPGHVADGKDQPTPDVVVEPAVPVASGQTRLQDHPLRKPPLVQTAGQDVPARRGEPQLKSLHHSPVVTPPPHVVPGVRRLLRLQQAFVVEAPRLLHRVQQAAALLPGAVRTGGAGQDDARPVGQLLQRLPEFQSLRQFQKGEHVPALAAAEAVEQPPPRVDGQGGRLLGMERADRLPGGPRPPDGGNPLEQRRQINGAAHPFHFIATSHTPKCRRPLRHKPPPPRPPRRPSRRRPLPDGPPASSLSRNPPPPPHPSQRVSFVLVR